jgi:hypothetical protein
MVAIPISMVSSPAISAGSYTVEVTDDNSCTATIPVTITEPDPTTTANAGTDQTSCFGNTATLPVTPLW